MSHNSSKKTQTSRSAKNRPADKNRTADKGRGGADRAGAHSRSGSHKTQRYQNEDSRLQYFRDDEGQEETAPRNRSYGQQDSDRRERRTSDAGRANSKPSGRFEREGRSRQGTGGRNSETRNRDRNPARKERFFEGRDTPAQREVGREQRRSATNAFDSLLDDAWNESFHERDVAGEYSEECTRATPRRGGGRISPQHPHVFSYDDKRRGEGDSKEQGRHRGDVEEKRGFFPSSYDKRDGGRPDSRPRYKAEPSRGGFREGAPSDERAGTGHQEDNGLLPGVKPVLELLLATPERVDAVYLRKGRHGSEMAQILDICRKSGIRFSLMESEAFAKAFPHRGQGVIARLYETGFTELEDLYDRVMDAPLPLIVMLDQVQDPGNAGTLARTLYSFGGAGLVIPRHNGVYLGAAAQKASAGALLQLPVAKTGNLGQALDAAKKLGFTIYGTGAAGEKNGDPSVQEANQQEADVFSFKPRLPAILLLGSEESGMRQTLSKRCDMLINIPMLRDFDSLNVAQAGAVCLTAFLKHVISAGAKGPQAD